MSKEALMQCELQEVDGFHRMSAELCLRTLRVKGESSHETISLREVHQVSARFERKLGVSAFFAVLLYVPFLVSGAVYSDPVFLLMTTLAGGFVVWNMYLLAIGQTVLRVSYSGGQSTWRKLGRSPEVFRFAEAITQHSLGPVGQVQAA